MRIAVLIKQVLEVGPKLDVVEATGRLEEDNPFYVVNPPDLSALQWAIQTRSAFPGTEIRVLTAGPPRAEEALRECLAMGADEAVHVILNEFEDVDSVFTADLLARPLAKGFDLILTGSRSADYGNGVTGARIGSLLDLPFLSAVQRLDIIDEQRLARAQRRIEYGRYEIVECELPGVFALEKGIADPRTPSLGDQIRTQKMAVKEITVQDLSNEGKWSRDRVPASRFGGFAPARRRPKKTFVPPPTLLPADRISLLMSGGPTRKRRSPAGSDLSTSIDEFVRILMEQELFPAPKEKPGNSS